MELSPALCMTRFVSYGGLSGTMFVFYESMDLSPTLSLIVVCLCLMELSPALCLCPMELSPTLFLIVVCLCLMDLSQALCLCPMKLS
jgi:hypothetical protein